jgi:hypothetical protein
LGKKSFVEGVLSGIVGATGMYGEIVQDVVFLILKYVGLKVPKEF